jgi:hypothetical protein
MRATSRCRLRLIRSSGSNFHLASGRNLAAAGLPGRATTSPRSVRRRLARAVGPRPTPDEHAQLPLRVAGFGVRAQRSIRIPNQRRDGARRDGARVPVSRSASKSRTITAKATLKAARRRTGQTRRANFVSDGQRGHACQRHELSRSGDLKLRTIARLTTIRATPPPWRRLPSPVRETNQPLNPERHHARPILEPCKAIPWHRPEQSHRGSGQRKTRSGLVRRL